MKNLVRRVATNNKTLQIQQHSTEERFTTLSQTQNITQKLLLWRQKFLLFFPICYISKVNMRNSDKNLAAGTRNLYLSVWNSTVNYMRQPT